jgi:ankyrin repeat protein
MNFFKYEYPFGPATTSDTSNDREPWIDPLVTKFGEHPLVREARDPERVQHLLQGVPITAEALFAAADGLRPDTMEVLLAANGSPNMRSDNATDSKSTEPGIEWARRDNPPTFHLDQREWYALQFAAHACSLQEYTNVLYEEDISNRNAVIICLLKHGADPYAIYRQPLRLLPRCPFPGNNDAEENKLDLEGKPYSAAIGAGLRTVIHSIIEDGGCIKPFLDNSEFANQLEHRDSRGHTIMHAACRRYIGADFAVEVVAEDVRLATETSNHQHNPFNLSEAPSLFQTLKNLGADLRATDNLGKHVLHHLLEAQDPDLRSPRLPLIGDSLQRVFSAAPELVNQPDSHGNYPLHAAMQRWRRHPDIDGSTAGLASIIDDILAAGADPFACDSRGNTVLHYLADDGLTEQLAGEATRRLFKTFLDRGVDVNARNSAGRTAAEMLFDDSGACEMARVRAHGAACKMGGLRAFEDIDAEVFGWLDEAGVNWMQRSAAIKNRTLLHVVAQHRMRKVASRCSFLLAKGLDSMARDDDGKTAIDVAEESNNREALQVFDAAAAAVAAV